MTVTNDTGSRKATPAPKFHHGPRTGKALAVATLAGLPAWFALKFALPSESGVIELLSAFVALGGVVSGIVLFLGTYGFWANAPAELLDERQVAERDRAYVLSFRALALLCLAGWFAAELLHASSTVLTTAVLRNFLLVVFFLALMLPAAVTALRDTSRPDDE